MTLWSSFLRGKDLNKHPTKKYLTSDVSHFLCFIVQIFIFLENVWYECVIGHHLSTVLPLNLRIIRLTLLKKEKNNMTIWVKWAIKTLLTQPRNSTSDFKAVDQRWINADLKLKMKENLTSNFWRCKNLIQCQCPTMKQGWNKIMQR